MACLVIALISSAAAVSAGTNMVEGEMKNHEGGMESFANPIQVPVADPCVYHEDGTYYLYGTWGPSDCVGVPVYTSKDLVHWQWGGLAFEKTEDTWSQVHFWGPEVVKRDGVYYMFYNASPNKKPGWPFNMHLCIAQSESPLGPFREVRAPFYQPEGPDEAIDQSLMVDDDGQAYLYFTVVTEGRNDIRVVRLSDDWMEFEGEPVLLIKPEAAWEDNPWDGHRVAEGAYAFKHKGTYYLLYTANHFLDSKYAVGYAAASDPMGPFTRYEGNPILSRSAELYGPGNAWPVHSPDGSQVYLAYHVHQSTREVGWRQLAIDRLRFEPQPEGPDRIVVDGPTHTPQPLPAGAAPWPMGASDDFSGDSLGPGWFVLNEMPEHWRLEDGSLVADALDGDMWKHRADFRNLFLQYAPAGDFAVEAAVSFSPSKNYEQAFLCVWQDYDNYVRLAIGHSDGVKLMVSREKDGAFEEDAFPMDAAEPVQLRITSAGGVHRFAYKLSQGGWQELPVEVKHTLMLPRVGLGAIGPGSNGTARAAFAGFEIKTSAE